MAGNETIRDHILGLRDGWGGDPRNKAFVPEFVDDAIALASRIVVAVEKRGNAVPRPCISPYDGGSENSIDIHWKTGSFQLLVTVDEKTRMATVYGRRLPGNDDEIERDGPMLDMEPGVVEWLSRVLSS